MPRRFSFLLLCLVLRANLSGQDVDSLLAIERIKPTQTRFDNLTMLQDSFVEMDAKLEEAQRQVQSRRDLLVYQDLGTHFSPLLDLARLHTPNAGLVSGNYSLAAFQNSYKSRAFYNAEMPFTSFRYAQGGQQYIQFDALHTQNIIPTWNVAAGIQSFTNKGYGLRQLQVHRAPFVTSHFTWPNNRFRILTSMNWVRRSGFVSGGLSDRDSIFVADEKDTIEYAATAAYNLLPPGVERNALQTSLKGAVDTVRLTNHMFRFQYHLGSKHLDTMDSIYRVKPIFGLFHQLGYQKETWLYNQTDTDSSFFRSLYSSGELSNRDSQVFQLIRNEVGFEKYKLRQSGLGFEGHAGVELGRYVQNTNIELGTLNTYIGGSIRTLFANRIGFHSKGDIYLSGYNAGDYSLSAQGTVYTPWAVLKAGLASQLYEPAPVHRFFINPNFIYFRLGLQKTLSNRLEVSVKQRNAIHPIRLTGSVHNFNNYIYFDSTAKPFQSSNAIQHLQLQVSKRFHWKQFNLDIQGVFQGVSSSVVDMPVWALKADLFYQNYLADSALHLKAGLDLFYNAQFKAARYLPMLRQYYYANRQALGGYPLLDAYISGEVKSLTVFFKMENILNGIYFQREVKSYSTHVYPIQPMAFRLGLYWDFYF